MLLWLRCYRCEWLAGDIVAGLIVALMLIPQGMAYAIIAGLPPVNGLYASILPAIAYALFGSSRVQSVGPMAITSLMVGSSLPSLAPPGSSLYVVLAGQLALIAGGVLLLCGIFRLGFLASLLSRPVMSGFTTGAALLITAGQLQALLGGPLAAIHPESAIVGLGSLLALWLAKSTLHRGLGALGLSARTAETISRLAPVAVLAACRTLERPWAGYAIIMVVRPSELRHVQLYRRRSQDRLSAAAVGGRLAQPGSLGAIHC
ncbi:MAG: SulP family inorganic anion transporter [Accumulibacter sp.]|uniref:SulP family inorganic anion transporter n=1 Tax=Accumulibacter sp. TaxID=2053492 RepID=UPI00331470C6